MQIKKITVSLLLTVLLIYIVSVIALLKSYINDENWVQIFNPIFQFKTWLFVFGWSLGIYGYILMGVISILLFWAVFKLLKKFNLKNK